MKGKKRAIGGWVFAFVFVAVQLLYCALDLGQKVSMRTPPFDYVETPMGELIDQVIAFLRHFLAGPSLVASPSETLVPREIGGACLIGLFVVAASVWLLADLSLLGYGPGPQFAAVRYHGECGGQPVFLSGDLFGGEHRGGPPQRRICATVSDPRLAFVYRPAQDFSGCRGAGKNRIRKKHPLGCS